MSITTQAQDLTASHNLPQTPSRHDKDPTPPSSDTVGSDTKRDQFSADDEEGDTLAPPHPFLAYARRVRSFTSPLKINRARYLLTFVDVETSQEWWTLMQQEYPDSVRESSQLFSFKSDRVPARAWENPRFGHLKDKWTFRQLDDKENQRPDKSAEKPPRMSRRGSLMRMLSTPSLGTIGEISQPPTHQYHSPAHLPEDPFTEPTPPRSIENSIDFGELNRMLERMQMMMNQTQLRIDVLAERQQMYVESLERLQTALEANSTHIQALATQHQVGAITTKNLRTAIEQNASHMRTILERQVHDVDREQQMENKMSACSQRVDEVMDMQRVGHIELRDVKGTVGQTAGKVQTILDQQKAGDEKLDAIMAALEKSPPSKKQPERSSPTPSAGGIQRLQATIEQQSVQLAGLITAQKAGNKHTQKLATALDAVPTSQDENMEQRLAALQAAHEKEMKQLKRDMTKVMNDKLEKLTAAQDAQFVAMREVVAKAVKKKPPTVVQCDHDVAPPPRKMNKELLGYWYKRT
ncbi:hypothetical protein K461DRAFT_275402 [Myriangium duriaei CBS 260.36]|uniref:Uncharacterized protein n=1 Tax=Myriangium duriaei CBS 260.36 TaxID=1168546 RepID=A0A9P4MIS1_9PEZI|nr:hypothetical protein K461DRAFT_275402 [Myriangium duriaei CBS 260.36]